MALWLDDGFADHPKIVAAGPALAMKHLSAMGWASRHRTGGHIPRGVLRQLSITSQQAERLQAVGLWDAAEGGWRIHDWDVYNGDAATAKRRRDQKAARQRRWREGRRDRGDVDAGVDSRASTPASTVDASTSRAAAAAQHIPSRPVPPRDGTGDGTWGDAGAGAPAPEPGAPAPPPGRAGLVSAAEAAANGLVGTAVQAALERRAAAGDEAR